VGCREISPENGRRQINKHGLEILNLFSPSTYPEFIDKAFDGREQYLIPANYEQYILGFDIFPPFRRRD
jgi:hypothetical protein